MKYQSYQMKYMQIWHLIIKNLYHELGTLTIKVPKLVVNGSAMCETTTTKNRI